MNRRAILFLILSAVCGVVALIFFRAHQTTPAVAAGPPRIPTVTVVLAASDISPGVPIAETSLRVVEWPEKFTPPGSFASADGLVDRVSRRVIQEGEPVLANALLDHGDPGGLAALIEPNHRAMSVEVNAVVGVSGFIKPGSRVDVLAQLRTMDRDKGVIPHARTILQNVKVLAIDQKYAGVNATEAALASVVTLQVRPDEAQRLAYAAAEGKLQLALRGRTDEDVLALRNTMPDDFLDAAPPKPKPVVRKSKPRPSIESIRGTDVGRDYL